MKGSARKFLSNTAGAVAPTVALALFGLAAMGGVAFDYARLVSMDSELQNAADQAALAAATQLDGQAGAMTRAEAAARNLLTNTTLFANDGQPDAISLWTPTQADAAPAVVFYPTKTDAEADTNGFTATTAGATDANAKFVRIRVATREIFYALTPIVGAMSNTMRAFATAGMGSAICKVPPVMICNPDEDPANTDEYLEFVPTPGVGLRLVTGGATAPGNFGWLEAGLGNGSAELAAALGYNNPPGECQEITGVTTKTGMDAAVLNAFNTRFDIFANGNMTCPAQGGGSCSPSVNTRKDLVCDPDNTDTLCTNDQWEEASDPYRLPTNTTETCVPKKNGGQTCTTTTSAYEGMLPTDGTQDPEIMGYPRDLCHSWLRNAQTCGIRGNGSWDRDAYFRVNYKWDHDTWSTKPGLSETASRWQVYQWEMTNPSVIGGDGETYGINHPQKVSNSEAAFSYPATGRAGVEESENQPDRRKISVAVLNCVALNAKGKTTNVPVPTWLEVFLVEPAVNRGSGSNVYTDQKDIYVEMIGESDISGAAATVVRRDVPYLIK